MSKKTLSFFIVSALLIMSVSAQIKDRLPSFLSNQYLECKTTDTISNADNKSFKPAYSRIAINQLAINFSKLFHEKFPNENITVPINIVFQLTISESGEIQATEITRSLFPDNINMELIGIVKDVTVDSWEPAIYQGKKTVSQVTLPITVFPKK